MVNYDLFIKPSCQIIWQFFFRSRVGNAVAKLATTFRSSKVVEERIVNDNSGDCAVQSEGLE